MRDDGEQNDVDVDLDLEAIGKKKKKKKKPFNLDELDNALPAEEEEKKMPETSVVVEEPIVDDNFDLDMDFSKTKKKKKKKKDLDELMAEADEKQDDKENGNCFFF